MLTKPEALAAWDVVRTYIDGGTPPPTTGYPPADCYLNPVPGAGQVPPGFDTGLSQQPEHRWSLPQNSTLCLDTRPAGQVALYTRCAEDGLIPLRNVDGSTNPTISNANFSAEVARLDALLLSAAPPTTFVVSGNIKVNGVGLAGVQVGGVTTDAAGHYAITVNSGASVTLVPALTGYTFAPASRTETNVTANVSEPDFVATAVVNPPAAGNTIRFDDAVPGQLTGQGHTWAFGAVNDPRDGKSLVLVDLGNRSAGASCKIAKEVGGLIYYQNPRGTEWYKWNGDPYASTKWTQIVGTP